MNGSIDKAGNAVIRWNIQEGKFYSPDGTQHCLPCETCGDPQWVSLPTVSVVCSRCAEPDPDIQAAPFTAMERSIELDNNAKPGDVYEDPVWGTVHVPPLE